MNTRELFEKISDLEEITVHIPTKSELTSLNGVISSRMNLRPINYLRKSEVLELIEQLDEPKKPVIPQFVADWIESMKKSYPDLGWCLTGLPDDDDVSDWMDENPNEFFSAWLYGYEVEKEKLYTVEIPNGGNWLALTSINGRIKLDHSYKHSPAKLTESEIKKDFQWIWDTGFATEVVE